MSLFAGVIEKRRVEASPNGPLPESLARVPSVDEATRWARFPVVAHASTASGGARVEVADLRYHLRGEPTLRFVVELSSDGDVVAARMERGGSARELFERFRNRK